MDLSDSAEVTATMKVVDRILDDSGVPSYTELWATNTDLRAEINQLKDRLAMSRVALSKAQGDLLQTEMIVGTAASLEQAQRELTRMKCARESLEQSEFERFELRWGVSRRSEH